MNLRQLRYFVHVVDAGNMTRAAAQLRIAQTALGMQIKQLEDDLGVTLLIRHSRGIEATKAGTLLYERATTILRLIEDTRKEVSACERERPEPIRLGITPALMQLVGADIAVTVRDGLAHVMLSLVEAMSHVLVEMLSRGEVDFILCYDVPDQPQLSRIALLQDDLVLVTLPTAQDGEPIAFVDALKLDLAMPEQGDTVRSAVTHAARQLGLEVTVAYEVRSISAMKGLVSRGGTASILPFASVVEEVRAGKLGARPIEQPSIRRTLFLATARQRHAFRNEAGIITAVRTSLKGFTDALGPLAHPLPSPAG